MTPTLNPDSAAPSTPDPERDRTALGGIALLGLFAASGAAALIYELVWFQWLQLVLGLTSVSLGLILGIFMGGMGLGSFLLPRWVSPHRHPLRVYAMLELGIGVWALGLLIVGPAIADWYTAHAGGGVSGAVIRGGLAAICLLPPTLLMGATLPAVGRWGGAGRNAAGRLGSLYAGNTCGAVLGCLGAGFYLLRVHDVAVTTGVAIAINAVAAAVAWVLSCSSGSASERGEAASGSPVVLRSASSGSLGRSAIYWVAALSGATALGAEVVWTRLLGLLMGGTVYTFSILLAVFLMGLGIGSTAGSQLARTLRDPRRALGVCQLCLIAAVAWAAWMIPNSLPHWPVNPALSLSPWFNFQLDLARGLWAVLPAALLWGASFPLALGAVSSSPEEVAGRWVGGLYAANTLGSIAGALGFSLAIVPLWGTQGAERMLLGLAVLAAGIALWPVWRGSDRSPSRWWTRVSIPIALCVGWVLASRVPATPWGLAAYGRFVATYGNRLAPEIVPESQISTADPTADIHCTYLGEGLNGSIAVTRLNSGVRNFHSAGKVQASNDRQDMRLQRMLGHLSALVHGKAESVLVVACGAGVTAGSFVPHPETRQIVICDIEPLVPQKVAPLFAQENFNVIGDPRTRVVSDDGRHYIRTTRQTFDVITSDPIDPWVKGCAALNTVEYYRMCRDHLNPGGVMSLWVPLYESDRETVRSLIATFFEVFPHATLWSNDDRGEGYDAVLLGQVEATRLDLAGLQARLQRPDYAAVRRSLQDAGFPGLVELLGTYAGRAGDLVEWTRGAPLNTDRNLRLQYLAGWSVNSFASGRILDEIVAHRRFPEDLFVGSEEQRHQIRAHWPKSGSSSTPVERRAAR